MTRSKTIQTTKNYRLFKISEENRPLNLAQRKSLRDSMSMYGFLKSFPVSCYRNGDKSLVVKDGQNRLAIAEELGLPVHYFVDDVDYDIATVNNTQKTWTVKDYAMKYAAKGVSDYVKGLEFCSQHEIPVSKGFALLAGTTNYSNISSQFKSGLFKIKDREFADIVASAYARVCKLSTKVRSDRFLSALLCACLVDGFDAERFVSGCTRCADKLNSFSTTAAYIDMIEEIYNYGRRNMEPIKIPAMQILKERNVATRGKQKSALQERQKK